MDRFSRIFSPLFLAVCLHGPAVAAEQSQRSGVVKVLTPADTVVVAAGSTLELPVRLEIAPGLHINAEKPTTEYLIPTKLEWTSKEFRLLGVAYPRAERYRFSFAPGKPLNVYQGTIRIRSRFRVPREAETKKVTLRGVVHYQACDDKACYPPAKAEVIAPVHVINVRERR